MKETSSAHHLQSTIPKVKCAGSSLMLWGCFSVAGTEGLNRIEEKLNAPKYWESLNENPVQSIQNLRQAEGSPSNRTMDLNTQQEWLIHNAVNVLEWPSHMGLNPIKYFWRNLKMCVCPIQPERAWEVKRWGEQWRIIAKWWWAKLVAWNKKKTWGCKGTSAKYLVKGMNTYAILFEFFIFNKFTKLWRFCFCFVNMAYGV